jgi:hypothetical protein
MAATRNGAPVRASNVFINPVATVVVTPPPAPSILASPNQGSALAPGTVVQNSLMPGTTPVIRPGASTTANLLSSENPAGSTQIPIISLTGTPFPIILPPLYSSATPTPLRQLTQKDMLEETLQLDTYTFSNGNAVQDVSSMRCDILSILPYRSIYDKTGRIRTTFGTYVDDLYQSSAVRDTIRKYLIVNGLHNSTSLSTALNSISTRVFLDLAKSERTINYLDALVERVREISQVLDVKTNLAATEVGAGTNIVTLTQFVTSRLLFSEAIYNNFSDTKVLYQLLSDLLGILDKCSFNLISGFTDEERRIYSSNPLTFRKQTVQDAITLDLSYGDNLAYSSDVLKLRYINSNTTFNGLISVLPPQSQNRFKFIINLLSRELKVSKRLGKGNLVDSTFFGFSDRGNPFDNIVGRVPSDIFMSPEGSNSLAGLFYIKTGNSNVIVLPFENRQVVGDNETVFVPGATYFADGILNGDFSVYNNYTEHFGTRVNKAKSLFDELLLHQSDATSAPLEPLNILKETLRSYKASQTLIRKDNNDATALLTFVLMLVANGDPGIKFEVFKLLLLVILNDSRHTVTTSVANTDQFRELLFRELANEAASMFSGPLTEASLPAILATQIDIVKQWVLKKIPALAVSNQSQTIGKQQNTTAQQALNDQRSRLTSQTQRQYPPGQKSTSSNTASIPVSQFSMLGDSLRSKENNLFKGIANLGKLLFTACSRNDTPYHLLNGASATRYNGLTLSGYMLLLAEMFGCLVDQFARSSITYNLVSGPGGSSVDSQLIQLSFTNNSLAAVGTDIDQYVYNGSTTNDIIRDYDSKLKQENNIIENILLFFLSLNQGFRRVTAPTDQESKALLATFSQNTVNTLASTRTAKSIYNSYRNKINVNNLVNSNLFYLPSGKYVGDKNYAAMNVALRDPNFVSDTNRWRVASVGIPDGFTRSVLSARINKESAYQGGQLHGQPTDLVEVSVYKLDRHDEGLFYKPQTFMFDLALFPVGFSNHDMLEIRGSSYYNLSNKFQMYDFTEYPGNTFSNSAPLHWWELVNRNPFYSRTQKMRDLGLEVSTNLYRSYILDLYTHLLTGLNISEETFIRYSETEMSKFLEALRSLKTSNPNYLGVKLMTPEYRELLASFSNDPDNFKLALTLCNDIPSSVFRQKQFDRVLTIAFDVDKFVVDENQMRQTNATQTILSTMTAQNRLTRGYDGNLYKVKDNFVMDQYFINAKIVQK